MIRPPAVAGRFYPADPNELAHQIKEFCPHPAEKKAARGCVVPHAGYMYSGAVAGAVYSGLDIPKLSILIGPRHFPRGKAMAILTQGSWQTPLGEMPIDAALASALAKACPLLSEDSVAHEREHSLEVQLPFLQVLHSAARFVPVVLGTDRWSDLESLGNAVAQVILAQRDPVLLVASSDMNHYESDAVTRVKDKLAIDRILSLDPRGLYDTVRSHGITMCGYAAAVVMLITLQALGANEAQLVRYATSGDVTGDREEVVGYAGIILRENLPL